MECGYNNYPAPFSYPRVYPNFPTAMPPYYTSNLMPHNGSLPAPVGGIPGIHGATMSSLNPELPYFASDIASQPFAAMNAVASMTMSSAQYLESTGVLNNQNHPMSRSNGQVHRGSRSNKDDVSSIGKPASLQIAKAASESSEPSPGSGVHRPGGAQFDAGGGSDNSNHCAAGPGSLASIGLKDTLMEDALNQRIVSVLRSPTVITFLREHQRRLYQQRREKSNQERSALQQHQHQQRQQQQQHSTGPPMPTSRVQLSGAPCGQSSPAHTGYVTAASAQLHPFQTSHSALNSMTENYGY